MNDNNNNDNNDNRSDGGEYWWVLPLLGFLAVVGFMMAEMAFFAALP